MLKITYELCITNNNIPPSQFTTVYSLGVSYIPPKLFYFVNKLNPLVKNKINNSKFSKPFFYFTLSKEWGNFRRKNC